LGVEARNLAAVAAGQDVGLPEVHEDLCTARVLVMGRLTGTPMRAAGPVLAERGADRVGLARTLLSCLLRQRAAGPARGRDDLPPAWRTTQPR
jgi:ubiquinone biosynthesis protein